MSQWTHVLGIIRFDSFNKNVWPEPPNKHSLVKDEVSFIDKIFQESNIPYGSEGPIEINTILTERGPTVILAGDLRDFWKEDLGIIKTWIEEIMKKIKAILEEEPSSMFFRDGYIICHPEFSHPTFLYPVSYFGSHWDFKEVETRQDHF